MTYNNKKSLSQKSPKSVYTKTKKLKKIDEKYTILTNLKATILQMPSMTQHIFCYFIDTEDLTGSRSKSIGYMTGQI